MDNKYNPKSEIKVSGGVFVPQQIAQRCPVCNGFGTLKYGAIQCQGCGGKGYVLVPAKEEQNEQE